MIAKPISSLAALILALTTTLVSATPANSAPTPTTSRPNVILINIDDLGPAWLPPYAKRLKPSDIEPVICQLYAEQAAKKKETFDLNKHLETAQISMPTLDKLANQGAVFNWCFSTSSLCAPSRCALITGRYQQHWGSYSIPDVLDIGLPKGVDCLVKSFQQAGYHSGLIGKWHVAPKDPAILAQAEATLGNQKNKKAVKEEADRLGYETSSLPGQHPLDQGFDYYYGYNSHGSNYYETEDLWENRQHVPKRPPGEFLTDLLNAKAADFVTQSIESKKPFFLYYAPMTVHGQLLPPPASYSSLFNSGVKQTNDYAGHLRALDEGIRRIFEILKDHHQDQNTLFILTADNGGVAPIPPYNAPFRGGKGNGWLGGSHEPLIIYWPGHIQPMVCDELISHMDLLPTALAAAGITLPPNLDGKSLLPLLSGQTKTGPHTQLYSSGLHSANWSYSYFPQTDTPQNGNRGKPGKIADQGTCPLYVWGLNKTAVKLYITPTRAGVYDAYPEGRPAQSLLFDLTTDIKQTTDLSKTQPELDRTMTTAIKTWLGTTLVPASLHQNDYPVLLKMDPSAQSQAAVPSKTKTRESN